jgi:hypothetical protein
LEEHTKPEMDLTIQKKSLSAEVTLDQQTDQTKPETVLTLQEEDLSLLKGQILTKNDKDASSSPQEEITDLINPAHGTKDNDIQELPLNIENEKTSFGLKELSETESSFRHHKENVFGCQTQHEDLQSHELADDLSASVKESVKDFSKENSVTLDGGEDSQPDMSKAVRTSEDANEYDFLSKIIGLPTKSSESNQQDYESSNDSEKSEEESTMEITDGNQVHEKMDLQQSIFKNPSDFQGLDSASNLPIWDVDEIDSKIKGDPFEEEDPFTGFKSEPEMMTGNFYTISAEADHPYTKPFLAAILF